MHHEAKCKFGQTFSILSKFYQLELIADPYSDHQFLEKNDSTTKEEMPKM